MNQELINTGLLAVAFLALFGSAELLFHYVKVKAEYTRKIVHIGTGLLTMLFPVMLNNHWLVLILCASFLMILVSSLRFSLLPSINAIDRKSNGSILYPVIVYFIYLGYDFIGNYSFFYLPILVMAIGDPMAALIGKRWPFGVYSISGDKKTLVGSSAFFVTAIILSVIILKAFLTPSFVTLAIVSFSVALTSTIAEGMSRKGFDNFSIPATVFIVLFLFHKIEWL